HRRSAHEAATGSALESAVESTMEMMEMAEARPGHDDPGHDERTVPGRIKHVTPPPPAIRPGTVASPAVPPPWRRLLIFRARRRGLHAGEIDLALEQAYPLRQNAHLRIARAVAVWR